MNYFENIEGLIEQTDENIENIEKRTEKVANDDTDYKNLSERDILEKIAEEIKNLKTLGTLASLSEDISDAMNLVITNITTLEKLIKDEQLKAKIQVMKFEVTKQFGIDLTSSKIR